MNLRRLIIAGIIVVFGVSAMADKSTATVKCDFKCAKAPKEQLEGLALTPSMRTCQELVAQKKFRDTGQVERINKGLGFKCALNHPAGQSICMSTLANKSNC